MKEFAILVVLSLLQLDVCGLECGECAQVDHPDDCSTMTTCDIDSKCSVMQQHSVTWRKVYKLGCIPSLVCDTMAGLAPGVINVCSFCCDTDGCNINLCGEELTTAATTTNITTTVDLKTTTTPTATETSTAETPTAETPSTETPTAETPTAKTATAETPSTETPTTETPTTETPTARTPTARTPSTETPTAETPTAKTATAETPTTETPTAETSTAETPTAETPSTETPTAETPTAKTATAETPSTETPTTETPTTETPTARTPTARTPSTETPTAETPTAKTATAETPTTETPTAETSTAETPTARTATAERKTATAQLATTTPIPTTSPPTSAIIMPPSIGLQPHHTVNAGKIIGIMCNATGTEPLSITWTFNSGKLPANAFVYPGYVIVLAALAGNQGSYSCHVSNKAGEATSQTYLEVVPLPTTTAKPTTQPTTTPTTTSTTTTPTTTSTTTTRSTQMPTTTKSPSTALPTASSVNPSAVAPSSYIVSVGQTITMHCDVSGSPSPVIVWDFNAGAGVPSNMHVSGSSVTIETAQKYNMGWYSCIAQNSVGVAYAVIKVTVTDGEIKTTPATTLTPATVAPTAGPYLITTHVQIVWHGDNVTLACQEVSTNYMPLSWSMMLATPASNVKFDSGTLTLTNAKPYNEGIYKCSAHDASHNIHEYTHIYVKGSKPEFVTQLLSQTTTVGGYAYYNCEVKGHPTPEVYFEHFPENRPTDITAIRSYAVTERVHMLRSGNHTLLLISQVEIGDEGAYRCVATNFYGTETSIAKLELKYPETTTVPHTTVVMVPPSIAMATNKTVLHGNDAILSCKVTGIPQPTIVWYFNQSSALPDNVIIQGNDLLINKATYLDDGSYECRADNSAGKASSTMNFNVLGIAPTITQAPVSQIKHEGEYLIVACDATGLPRPTINWSYSPLLKDDNRLLPPGVIQAQYGSTLVIPNIQLLHQGEYTCHADNGYGTIDSQATVIVTPRAASTALIG